jgi:hypothetical protein
LLGDHDGIPDADARTSAALVCGSLRDKGAQVGTEPIASSEAYGYGSAYRVALRPLGKLVVLHVSYESPVGRELRSRRLQLGSIEEMTVAAPRVADALLQGKALAETAKVDNLVGEETRKSRKQSGETFFAIGVFGFTLPDEAWAGYGVIGRFHYETARLAISIDARIGGSAKRDGDAHLYGIAVGGRYFLSDADFAPYLGGGFGVLWLGVRDDVWDPTFSYEEYRSRSGSGLAPFAEAGLEMLRMHDSRLDIGLRLDVPFYEIEGAGEKSYALPVSLLASYSFD